MEKKTVYIAAGGGALILLLLYWRSRNRVSVQMNETIPEVPETGMNIPGYQGGDFISDIDVLVNPELLGMLSYKFMPLYGFVGTTTIPVPVYVPVRSSPQYCDPPVNRGPLQDPGGFKYYQDMKRYKANPKYWCQTGTVSMSGVGGGSRFNGQYVTPN